MKVPPGNWIAPPGSNRSGGGGNETVGASGVEGHLGDLASMQAVTRVNAEQASKRLTQEPTRRVIGGAAADGTVRANEDHQTCRGNGDGKQAKLTSSNTGSPSGDSRGDQPAARESQVGPYGVAERLVVLRKPGNSGGGKGPQLKTNARSNKGHGD